MKKIIFAVIFSAFIIGYSDAYSQDSTKAVKKSAKVIKKDAKGKYHKGMKKEEKMEKKEDKNK